MIELIDLSKTYEGAETPAVAEVSLEVAEGELVVLLGESGCGKTTTLKMINRLIEPSSGKVLVGGEEHMSVPAVELRRQIGYVFQGVGLFPHMTVGENVAVVPGLLGWDAATTEARVVELLELVGLEPAEHRDRMPSELSGGQRQRVGLARALAARPRIMLMDEPFGALDPVTRGNLQEEYTRLRGELGLTTIMVTHDMTEALLLADRIAVMNGGRIVALGTPRQILVDSEHDYVRELMDTPRAQSQRVHELMAAAGDARQGG